MFAWVPGPGSMVVLLVLGVLLFGRRLPEIGRSLGKTLVEFKKGVKGMEEEVNVDTSMPRANVEPEPVRAPQRITQTAPKFDDAPDAAPIPPRV
jgi:sec-independent protein translocase protein TatA